MLDSGLCGEDIVAIAASAAVALAKDTPNAQISVLGDFFATLGSSLITIADRRTQQGIDCGNKDNKEKNT
ncbi:MAG: hypothetical protein FWC80_06265 [Firmicutes bacterium]|nr:hypothetical protein [Bacillota bacterium]